MAISRTQRPALWMLCCCSLLAAAAVSAVSCAASFPSSSSATCASIECPSYTVVHQGDGFSVRLYDLNSTVWMSTSAIEDTSFTSATLSGFLRLFQYIQGSNEEGVSVNMTAPVLTGITPSDGPFCQTTFIVRFFVPVAFQDDIPEPLSSLDLQVERWDSPLYFAVSEFSGFASDSNVAQEGASLASIIDAAGLSASLTPKGEEYIIAQYNSPFDITGRVNEVLIPLSVNDTSRFNTAV